VVKTKFVSVRAEVTARRAVATENKSAAPRRGALN
jgi:hypothetical protein